MYYQIGTAEPRGCIGSRAAKSQMLEEAIAECCERSLGCGIKEAWLRPVENGRMGEVVVTFIKGEPLPHR